MSVLYGAQLWENQNAEGNLNYDSVAANSTTFTVGDLLSYSSGQLVLWTGTSPVVGVCQKNMTTTSTNASATGAQATVPYIPVDETTLFRMSCNANLTGNYTDPGTYYNLTGGTGSMQVNVSNGVTTTTLRIVMIKKVSPVGDGNLQDALVVFVRRPTETSV